MVLNQEIDALITRFEMGQAYRRITEQMGVSAQLVAFVNYDNVTLNSLGLESLNIEDQHEQILLEIDENGSFEQIVTMLSEKIDRLGQNEDVLDLATENFISRLFEVKMEPYHTFQNQMRFHEHVQKLATTLISEMPSTFSISDWEAFESKVDSAFDVLDHESSVLLAQQVRNKEFDNPKAFSVSGWTEESYKKAEQWIDQTVEKGTKIYHQHKPKLDAFKHWMQTKAVHDNADHVKIIKIMNSSVKQFETLDNNLINLAEKQRPMLRQARMLLDKQKEV